MFYNVYMKWSDENFEIRKLIAAISSQENNDEKTKYFSYNSYWLNDFSMIYVDMQNGTDNTVYLNKFANLNYELNSLYSSNKLLCFNNQVLANCLLYQPTIIKYQVCISFDLNIVSQLRYLNNKINSDEVLKNVEDICKSQECSFDIMPYIIENYCKDINNLGINKETFEDIKNFETMFPFKNYKEETNPISLEERIKKLTSFYQSKKFKTTSLYLYKEIYEVEYTYLLAIVFIYLKYIKLSSNHKLEKFYEFCNNYIKAFHPCSCNLAKLFYENNALKFFRHIQKNNKNIIQDIKNMAWDLFHLRFMEKSLGFSHTDPEIIMIPIFISKDKGLNEIRKAYQVNCVFKNLKTRQCFFNYAINPITKNTEKYFTNIDLMRKRMETDHNFKKLSNNIEGMILSEIQSQNQN